MRTSQTSTRQERIVGRRSQRTRSYARRCRYCRMFRPCRRLPVLEGGQLLSTWVCRRCKRHIWDEGKEVSMKEATLRCKRLLQAIITKEETLSIKRMQACAELEILLEEIAQALPADEQTAVKEVLELYERLWS